MISATREQGQVRDLTTARDMAMLVAPLAAICAGQISADTIQVYHAVWRSIEPRWLKAAIARYLATTTDRWPPMPAAIADLARSLKAADRLRRIEAAPFCPICRASSDGLVDAVVNESGERQNSLACCCVRGEALRESGRAAFDPARMRTVHESSRRALLGAPDPGQVRIPDLSVPAPQRAMAKKGRTPKCG